MKIAILGAGAMGMLFGGFLSARNEVWLLDVDARRVEKIARDGVRICDTEGEWCFAPHTATLCDGLSVMDLVIVFVKAMHTVAALEANRALIGGDTHIMTLQNGAGHETNLLQFADADHVIIGTTQHNSSVLENGCVHHGGGGMTCIGLVGGDSARLETIARNFSLCGFDCVTSDEVKKQVWEKLFLNTAASSLTAVLQVPLGFIETDPYACDLMEKLAGEAVAVANAQGVAIFRVEEVIEDIKAVLRKASGGYTSIYADVKRGAPSEVDTISGAVVRMAHALGVPVPNHEMIIALIHAMENKASGQIQ